MSKMLNKELRVDTDLHQKVVSRLMSRVYRSQEAMATRYRIWAEVEDQMIGYISETELDSTRKELRKGGQPQYTTIDLPYSYAMMLTAHTYLTSVFLSRDPVLQFQGRHGETQQQEQAVESIQAYQTVVGKHLPPYYVWFHDKLKYGLGIIGYLWEDKKIRTSQIVEEQTTLMGIPVGKPKKVRKELEVQGYQGTELYNVRPQDWITDPRVSFSQFQKGEYCGRYVELSFLDLVEGEAEGDYFNIDVVKERGLAMSNVGQRVYGSSHITLPNQNRVPISSGVDETTGMINCFELYVRLIPKDWGLGESKLPEKWVFVLANKEILIAARPLGYYHDQFPFEVLEAEVGGHVLANRSMLETLKPMNDVLSWLVNTHFYNVRKSLNDQFIVDPSKVVMKDMTDPNPGRMVRLRPEAYGTDVRMAVTQMPVQDVTRAHLQDFQLVGDMMQRIGGVNDSIMGMINEGRRSATEVRASTSFGVNRLKTMAEYDSAMGFGPLTQQLLQVTQQMYDGEQKFRIAGDLIGQQDAYVIITPDQIAGFYDFVPVDGTMPVDRFAQVNLWQQMLSQLATVPQIAGQYDFGRIFAFVAQLAGLKNITQFRINVVPDQVLQAQAAAGNSVPLGQRPGPVDASTPTPPQQIPGMGQTL